MNTEVWIKRVRVKCGECECWEVLTWETQRAKRFGETEEVNTPIAGRCHRESAKAVGDFDDGTWPVTKVTGYCFEGIQIEKDMLND